MIKNKIRNAGLATLFSLLLLCNVPSGIAQNKQAVDDKELINAQSAYIDGLAAFENENYQQALELLTAAYVKLPEHSGVIFALADTYFQINDIDNAEYYGKQAVKLDPQNQWYHLKLADIFREAGKADAVIEELKTALSFHPNDTSILYELARSYRDYGQHHKATGIYNKLLHLQGEDLTLRLQRLNTFSELDMRDSVITELQKIRDLDPDNLSTLQVLSNNYLEMERLKEAKEVLNNALQINKKDPQTLIMLSDVYIAEAKWDSVGFVLGNIVSDPSVSIEDKMKVAQYLYSAFESDQQNTDIRNATGSVLKQLIIDEPQEPQAQALGADFFIQTNQPDLALQALERTTQLIPTDDTAWKQRLRILLMENKIEEAIAAGKRAAMEIPQDPTILYFLGSAYLAHQQPQQAVIHLQEAEQLPARRPLKSNILASLGDGFASLKNWSSAFQYYEQSLGVSPDNAVVLNNYAYYLSQQQQKLSKAQEMAQKAVELEPQNPSFLDTLGWVYFKQSNYHQAKKYIQSALDTGDAGAEVMEHMGDVMDKLNNAQEAKNWWRKAFQKDSTRTHLKDKIST